MKHVKLFENFSLKVLPPVDISRPGEVVVAFMNGGRYFADADEGFCVTLISESELPMLKRCVSGERKLQSMYVPPGYDFEPAPSNVYFETQKPGIAYVYYTGMTKGDHDCEFVGPEFESKTPHMEYWITGNKNTVNHDNPHILQNWQGVLDGENMDAVFVLKRGMVLEMGGGGWVPNCYEYSLDEFLEKKEL